MQEVCEYLKKCGTYYLATVEGDQPRVRPFGTANIFEGKLYIQMGKSKAVSKQLAQNPKIEISAYDGENWIRLQAVAVEDDRVEARQSMLDEYPFLQSAYKADDGNSQVFYLKDAVATICTFAGVQKEIRF